MSMTKEQEEAISTMKHWIDCEKRNKDKIQKADELINIQETVLSMLQEQKEKIAKYEKIYKEYDCYRWVKELDKKDKIINDAITEVENIRQYFSEDLQPEFIRVLEILKDKKVIDW